MIVVPRKNLTEFHFAHIDPNKGRKTANMAKPSAESDAGFFNPVIYLLYFPPAEMHYPPQIDVPILHPFSVCVYKQISKR